MSTGKGAASTVVAEGASLDTVRANLDNSWVRQLSPESPENLLKSRKQEGLPEDDDNRTKRPVFNGHFVQVKPTGLNEPRLVLHSKEVAQDLLGLTQEQVESEEFVNWVSGNIVVGETWATPYALSIMGTRYTNNCPYGTGDGYGDGRAISIGEFNGQELQLKGGGTTPFHRGADGRAVLRSSIREFLASEAMHHLGISTTRALSLIVSEKDKISRPWYSEGTQLQMPKLDDPRLASYPLEKRKQILEQLRTQKADPNILITEKAAITCRVSPSFTRIGHLDLFARRAERASMEKAAKTNKRFDKSTNEWKELEDLVWHACYREFRAEAYDPFYETKDIEKAATVLLNESAKRIAAMVAGWVRVGFAQGNFNADNCLIAGRTMDYGPFGWMEEYNPLFAKWTGSGNHFGFMNQPSAGFANYDVLAESVGLVISAARGDESPDAVREELMGKAQQIFTDEVDATFRAKMGFERDQDVADDLWQGLEPLIRKSRTDWTVFFRRLTYVLREFPASDEYSAMLSYLEAKEEERSGAGAFYQPLSDELREEWTIWIEQWRTALEASGNSSSDAFEGMMGSNPKYVLREWMLVDAYDSAAKGQEAELFNLFDLIKRPYDEGSEFENNKYFRRAPDEALTTGGTAFMS
eukprot:CAMPEP_0172455102 /NCGR_PEP_ID=MMETSP1065-20121228/11894_1 /TAXON_ID=265537 /ORGANISM="Amphiprora paludosa, Strain CCMP125" /LENGTH=640 /DNA_ID=CAMNT_0013207557 /DNA_START=250 /DNA_END=2172 /DNA_ORIENTATION=-